MGVQGSVGDGDPFVEEKYGVRYPSKCEVCRLVAMELDDRLQETGKTHERLGTSGRKKYSVSELRLIETLEDLCERMMSYEVHKEYKDIRRFAKGQSQTMDTLEGLVAKGVKVDIGIPHELWKKPSVEITKLKTDCETLIEDYEPVIEEWYENGMVVQLVDFLCENNVLMGRDQTCLLEPYPPSFFRYENGMVVQLVDFLCENNVLMGRDQACLLEPYPPEPKTEKITKSEL